MCGADQREFGCDLGGKVRPVHAPLAAQQNDEIDAIERRPLSRTLTVALDERIAMVTKPFPTESGIAIIGVG